jgi:hypothetical protein
MMNLDILNLPWRVEYDKRCDEWDEQSNPRIVDSTGETICDLKQNVNHPGIRDEKAILAAKVIVESPLSHVLAFLSLHEAYRRAKSNEECAEILRLYCTDGAEFRRRYIEEEK